MSEYVSDCCGANIYWKEKTYFGKYTKSIWICFGCGEKCQPKKEEKEDEN